MKKKITIWVIGIIFLMGAISFGLAISLMPNYSNIDWMSIEGIIYEDVYGSNKYLNTKYLKEVDVQDRDTSIFESDVTYQDGKASYIAGYKWNNDGTTTKTKYDFKENQTEDLFTINLPTPAVTNGNRWKIHHESWLDDNLSISLLMHGGSETGSKTDNDTISFDVKKGKEWVNIGSIDLLSTLGFKEEELIDGKDYLILPTIWESQTIENNIWDFLHINAFDVNRQSGILWVSSRELGTIFGIEINQIYNAELKYILGNPTIFNYSQIDKNGNNPIVRSTEKGNSFGYIENPNYLPTQKTLWKGKQLDYQVGDKIYKSSEVKWDISEEYLFAGQHNVRSANQFLSSTGLYNDFDESKEYLGFFDNHSLHDSMYKVHRKSSGGEVYDLNNNNKPDKGAFGDGSPIRGNNEIYNSYYKIVEIDPITMTAKLIVNEPIPYSWITSNGVLFKNNEEYGLLTYAGYNGDLNGENARIEMQLASFDGISEDNLSFNNWNIEWNEKIKGSSGYRAIPIFEDFDKIDILWGLYYE